MSLESAPFKMQQCSIEHTSTHRRALFAINKLFTNVKIDCRSVVSLAVLISADMTVFHLFLLIKCLFVCNAFSRALPECAVNSFEKKKQFNRIMSICPSLFCCGRNLIKSTERKKLNSQTKLDPLH